MRGGQGLNLVGRQLLDLCRFEVGHSGGAQLGKVGRFYNANLVQSQRCHLGTCQGTHLRWTELFQVSRCNGRHLVCGHVSNLISGQNRNLSRGDTADGIGRQLGKVLRLNFGKSSVAQYSHLARSKPWRLVCSELNDLSLSELLYVCRRKGTHLRRGHFHKVFSFDVLNDAVCQCRHLVCRQIRNLRGSQCLHLQIIQCGHIVCCQRRNLSRCQRANEAGRQRLDLRRCEAWQLITCEGLNLTHLQIFDGEVFDCSNLGCGQSSNFIGA